MASRRESVVERVQRWLPQTPESARAVAQDETVASPDEDDVVPVGDEE